MLSTRPRQVAAIVVVLLSPVAWLWSSGKWAEVQARRAYIDRVRQEIEAGRCPGGPRIPEEREREIRKRLTEIKAGEQVYIVTETQPPR